MNKPELHHNSHLDLKQYMSEIINEYSSKLQWRPDGRDVLIDVGTGPGDISMNCIYPLLPPNFEKIVFTDITAAMIDYAKAHYGTADKSEFKVLDIATSAGLPSELEGKCDHVTSILVLHWVQDHRTSLKNMFNLLRPEGGDCLIVFMPTNSLCDAYHHMKETKWSEYIKDADRFISPLHFSKDPRGEFAMLMEEVGFSNIDVDFKHRTFQYESVAHMKEQMKSICATLDEIPPSFQSEFLDDFVAIISEYVVRNENVEQKYSKCTARCDLIVAYGQRAPVNKANNVQRHDAEEIIREYFPKLQWRQDGGDTLIDIGSGPGDVLIDFIYPRMPKDFRRIVCSDINPKMVYYAMQTYQVYEKCDFKILNIQCKTAVTNELKGQFDHVTSFYCFHWLSNLRQAFGNVYKLLRPENGDCLLLFLISFPIYNIYHKVRKASKWLQYVQDLEPITSALHYSKDPKKELLCILKDFDFSEYEVEIRESAAIYENEQIFRDNMKAINPFLHRMPTRFHQDFMDDFVEAAIDLGLAQVYNNGADTKFTIPSKLAVVYARK